MGTPEPEGNLAVRFQQSGRSTTGGPPASRPWSACLFVGLFGCAGVLPAGSGAGPRPDVTAIEFVAGYNGVWPVTELKPPRGLYCRWRPRWEPAPAPSPLPPGEAELVVRVVLSDGGPIRFPVRVELTDMEHAVPIGSIVGEDGSRYVEDGHPRWTFDISPPEPARFKIRPGRYEVEALALDAAHGTKPIEVVAGANPEVVVRIDASRGQEFVSGRVLSSAGEPVENAYVQPVPELRMFHHATTDATGRFVLWVGHGRRVALRVSGCGQELLGEAVVGEEAVLRFPPPTVLRVEIVDPEGAGPYHVAFLPGPGPFRTFQRSFNVLWLEPRKRSIYVMAADERARMVTFDLPERGWATVRIVLPPAR